MSLIELPTLIVQGSPTALGEAQGVALRPLIHEFLKARFAAVEQYCRERGLSGADELAAVGKRSMDAFSAWDPQGYAEHLGIAKGADLDPVRLYMGTNMTDLRDVLTLGADDPEGCSSVILPSNLTADGEVLAGQTWDLNPTDVDFVVAIRRNPDTGPATWSVTCAGCLSLMGINEHGVAVGTTNIKTRHNRRDGVGYLALIHRALRAEQAFEAATLIEEAPRAAAHTYWLVDAQHAISLETSPFQLESRYLIDEPWVQTNHCLSAELIELAGEEPSQSSLTRWETLYDVAEQGGHTIATVQAAFANRSQGILSVNRYPEDQQGTTTNAVFIARPVEKAAWACRGPADRGQFIRLGFGSEK